MQYMDIHPKVIRPDLNYDKWISNKVYKTNKHYIKNLIKKYLNYDFQIN